MICCSVDLVIFVDVSCWVWIRLVILVSLSFEIVFLLSWGGIVLLVLVMVLIIKFGWVFLVEGCYFFV